MKRKWLIPALAAALALVTTLVITVYLQRVQQQAAVVAPAQMARAVFAKTNIGERKVLRPDALELRQVPAAAIHAQAARSVEDVVNRVTTAPIYADEQILVNKLAPVGVNAGLAYTLPKDRRAMTIAVNEVVGVAGFVFPGDRVDIVSTARINDVSYSKIVLQDVEVLAIAQKVEQKPGEEPRVTTSATLALTPAQAEVLAQVDINGKVRLALRPYGSAEQVRTAGTTIEAAFGRGQKPAVASKPVAQPRPAPRRVTTVRVPPPPPPPPRAPTNVELWRGTAKSTVLFQEGRK